MKRTLISLMMGAMAVFALSANAATSVSLVAASGTTVAPGGTITLEVHVTANGGETDNTIFGAILYNQATVGLPNASPAGNSVQNTPTGFLPGALTCTTARCIAFNAVTGGAAVALQPGQNTDFVIATLTVTAKAADAAG